MNGTYGGSQTDSCQGWTPPKPPKAKMEKWKWKNDLIFITFEKPFLTPSCQKIVFGKMIFRPQNQDFYDQMGPDGPISESSNLFRIPENFQNFRIPRRADF